MKRIVRAATAALAVAGIGTIGCTHTGQPAGEGAAGGGAVYRQFVDPCWPERYNAAARNEVLAPFAVQVSNGNVLNQTLWNWYFEPGTDKLTGAGRAKLDSITQTRPAPDTRLYLQAARDVAVTPENIDKVGGTRDDLTSKRAAAIQRYMATQPVIGTPVAYEIHVHDAVPPGIAAEFAASAYRGQTQGYVGSLRSGVGNTGAVATGGGTGGNTGGSTGGNTGGSGSTGPTTGP